MAALDGLRSQVSSLAAVRRPAAKAATVAPRLYLIHGVDAEGASDHGRGGMQQIAAYLAKHGYPEARALSYNTDSKLVNQLAIPREQLFGTFSKRLTQDILSDLTTHPLAPGQQISLVGYSLGTQVAARVATHLGERNLPVRTLALIEPKNGNTPQALTQLPKVGRVLLVENQAEVAFKNPYRDVYVRHAEPQATHIGMVEKPPQSMLDFLVDNLK